MRGALYRSCHCRACRAALRWGARHKKAEAHRRFRHQTKQAVVTGRELPEFVSTGYNA